MTHDKFNGPLFIIGMPRSGTKLIRDLLNQNHNIGIPPAETHFIPQMIKKFGNPPRFDKKNEFHLFYKDLSRTNFWKWMRPYGIVLSKDYINNNVDKKSWSSIFEVILRFCAPPGRNNNFIWGDKSPTYLSQVKFLKEIFPKAKFLHIIRDPRDCSLSAKKVWGKNLYRTAELWRRRLSIARAEGHQLGDDYLEVLYETLLDEPERVISSICYFIDCDYSQNMIELMKPSENLGDTKEQARIVQQNKEKYLTELSPNEIKRIEEIVYPVAQSVPYKLLYNVNFKPLNSVMYKILALYDGISMIRFNINREGIFEGILYYYEELRDSGYI